MTNKDHAKDLVTSGFCFQESNFEIKGNKFQGGTSPAIIMTACKDTETRKL